MTPSRMFEKYGSFVECQFKVGDTVTTPVGISKVKGKFTRGLKWWVETGLGTFLAESINVLNQKS